MRLSLVGEEQRKAKTSADKLASWMKAYSGKISELKLEHMARLSLANPISNAGVRNSSTENISVWIGELTRLTWADHEFIWSSVLAIVDPEWGARLQEIKDLDKKNM